MRRATVTRFSAIVLVAAISPQTWGELYYEADDASQLVGTSQDVAVIGSVDGILGRIENAFDADLFRLLINDPPSFSAQVVVSDSQAVNPQLFLFDPWGHGVIANDDGLDSPLSHLPLGSLAAEPAGTYLLGISAADCDPRGLFGDIFPNVVTGVVRPEGLAQFYTLEDWRRDFQATGGNYAIALTGASGLVTPWPNADFEEDGDVDANDLNLWKLGYSLVGTATHGDGDADGDLDVDGSDYLIWQRQFDSNLTLVSADTAVPEPSTWILAFTLSVVTVGRPGRLANRPEGEYSNSTSQ